jgi:hypothetical protein
MLAQRYHGARLRAFGTLGMLRDKPHLVADRQRFEAAIGDTVAVKIDLLTPRTQDEAAILFGEKPHNPTMIRHGVQFDIAAPSTNVVFEESASSVKGVADRDINILMRVVCRGITPDDNFVARHFEIDTDAE